MEQGYGCSVEKVPSATTTSVASLAENGEPDIVTKLWLNSTGDVYAKLEAEGKVSRLADVFAPGGVEGWWVPEYLAEAHPELTTIKGIMANPELVGGRFNNCPDGWGCRIVNDNLIKALDLEGAGVEVFDHGSGETLATSIAAAYENKEPWFGYYWGPTSVLGQYKMAKVAIGDIDTEIHSANQNKDNPSPGVSDFPPAPVLTVATEALVEQKPEIAELINRLIEPTAGQVKVDGEDVLGYDEGNLRNLRRSVMSMVFQRFALLPHRTVVENAATSLKVRGVAKTDYLKEAQKWLDRVGLTGYGNRYPHQLSPAQADFGILAL